LLLQLLTKFPTVQKYFDFIKKLISFFRSKSGDERSLMEKLRDKYRLVIMNEETFEELTSVKLTPLSVYIAVSSMIVGTAILVTMLIIWTPLKRYIPGYGDFQRDAEIAELTGKVRNLEEEIEASRRFNENIRNILNGNVEHMGKESVEQQKNATDSQLDSIPPEDVDRIPEDEQLRSEVAKGTFNNDPALTAAAGVGAIVPRDVPLSQLFFMPPVSGQITSVFDLQKSHFGVDVGAPKNTAVKAAADGVVISAGYTVETGYSIAVQHPNNVVTMYKHNSVLLKSTGANLKAGEAIALIGNSGENSSGPHLHFELWYKGRPVNPVDYINFN
jgi:murein DD-endopeptidase MepM/ murein hydrolase activator NlpD